VNQESPGLDLKETTKAYLQKTRSLRELYKQKTGLLPSSLLICTRKPHNPAAPATIARWMLSTMKKSGIDTNTYKAHSARAAAAAGFKRRGMSLKNILAKADWSHKTNVYPKFYERSIQ